MIMNIAVTQYRHVDEMRPWSDREHLLECVAVTPEAADVMTFTFKPTSRALVPLHAGAVRDARDPRRS